jgi:hypothetical protein
MAVLTLELHKKPENYMLLQYDLVPWISNLYFLKNN